MTIFHHGLVESVSTAPGTAYRETRSINPMIFIWLASISSGSWFLTSIWFGFLLLLLNPPSLNYFLPPPPPPPPHSSTPFLCFWRGCLFDPDLILLSLLLLLPSALLCWPKICFHKKLNKPKKIDNKIRKMLGFVDVCLRQELYFYKRIFNRVPDIPTASSLFHFNFFMCVCVWFSLFQSFSLFHAVATVSGEGGFCLLQCQFLFR